MKVEELEKELNEKKIKSLYLLYGEEKFLLEKSVKKIKKIFGDTIQGINYVTLDVNNIDQIINEIETPSFGYDKKLIIAKNTELFKKEPKSKKDNFSMSSKLTTYLKENFELIKDNVIIVFIEDEADKNELKQFIEKNGIVCNFEYQKINQIQLRLRSLAKDYEVNIDLPTIAYLIECCGTSMQDLINEFRKLIEYAGKNGTIVKEDIDNLCIKKIESVIFNLTDNLGKKQIKQAINVLRNLILEKEPIQKILVTLYNHFKKLYLTKIALIEGKDIVYALDLKPNQTFLVSKYKTQAGYFKVNEIKTILMELCELDYKYKVGFIDIELGLESILCAYI